jgi:hypothetical protein
MIHTTISGNHANGRGGGILVLGTLNYENTIIAYNRGKGGNCVLGKNDDGSKIGRIDFNRHNLVSDDTCDPEHSGDPLLDPLSDNRGETMTHKLLRGSPAIDAIPGSHCSLQIDQRGESRPVVLVSAETPCDIGAFELQSDEFAIFYKKLFYTWTRWFWYPGMDCPRS